MASNRVGFRRDVPRDQSKDIHANTPRPTVVNALNVYMVLYKPVKRLRQRRSVRQNAILHV